MQTRLLVVASIALVGCGPPTPRDTHPRTIIHESVETGIHWDFPYRLGDISQQPAGRENLWVSSLNYYPNPIDGDSIQGARALIVAINDGASWSKGDVLSELVTDQTIFTIDGFDPLDRAGYTFTVVSDSSGNWAAGDTSTSIQQAVRDDGGNIVMILRWKMQSSPDEEPPGSLRWQGGALQTLRLCPEDERIAQGASPIGWCAFRCEAPSYVDPAYQLGEYPICTN